MCLLWRCFLRAGWPFMSAFPWARGRRSYSVRAPWNFWYAPLLHLSWRPVSFSAMLIRRSFSRVPRKTNCGESHGSARRLRKNLPGLKGLLRFARAMLLLRLAGILMLGLGICSSKASRIASIPLPLAMDFRLANAKCLNCGLRGTMPNISKTSSSYRVRRLRRMCVIFTRNATCIAEATLCACLSAISLGWLGCQAARFGFHAVGRQPLAGGCIAVCFGAPLISWLSNLLNAASI